MNRLSLLSLLLVGALCAGDQVGHISGTVAAVGINGRGVPCGNLTILVEGPSGEVVIQSDENGDYAVRMQAGSYELRKVFTRDRHHQLRLRDGQAHDFVVVKGRVTRFDVLIDGDCLSQLPTYEADSALLRIGYANIQTVEQPPSADEPPMSTPGILVRFADDSAKRETFAVSDHAGIAVVPLRPGKYCLEAFDKKGRRLKLAADQGKCFEINAGETIDVSVSLAAR